MKYSYNQKVFYERRKELRKNQTESEKILWEHLRNKKLSNLKFYRQYSIGPYILDFFCPSTNLAIELDGKSHDNQDARIYDQERSKFLEGFKIKVFRFKNEEVLNNVTEALNRICLLLDKRRLEEL